MYVIFISICFSESVVISKAPNNEYDDLIINLDESGFMNQIISGNKYVQANPVNEIEITKDGFN